MAAAELFVLPTDWENFGIVVGEALAAGAAVLTTRDTPWDWLEAESAGWWVEPTLDAVAAALAGATALAPEALAAMGRRGRERVGRDYAWPAVARQMRGVYAWLAGRGARPATVHD